MSEGGTLKVWPYKERLAHDMTYDSGGPFDGLTHPTQAQQIAQVARPPQALGSPLYRNVGTVVSPMLSTTRLGSAGVDLPNGEVFSFNWDKVVDAVVLSLKQNPGQNLWPVVMRAANFNPKVFPEHQPGLIAGFRAIVELGLTRRNQQGLLPPEYPHAKWQPISLGPLPQHPSLGTPGQPMVAARPSVGTSPPKEQTVPIVGNQQHQRPFSSTEIADSGEFATNLDKALYPRQDGKSEPGPIDIRALERLLVQLKEKDYAFLSAVEQKFQKEHNGKSFVQAIFDERDNSNGRGHLAGYESHVIEHAKKINAILRQGQSGSGTTPANDQVNTAKVQQAVTAIGAEFNKLTPEQKTEIRGELLGMAPQLAQAIMSQGFQGMEDVKTFRTLISNIAAGKPVSSAGGNSAPPSKTLQNFAKTLDQNLKTLNDQEAAAGVTGLLGLLITGQPQQTAGAAPAGGQPVNGVTDFLNNIIGGAQQFFTGGGVPAKTPRVTSPVETLAQEIYNIVRTDPTPETEAKFEQLKQKYKSLTPEEQNKISLRFKELSNESLEEYPAFRSKNTP